MAFARIDLVQGKSADYRLTIGLGRNLARTRSIFIRIRAAFGVRRSSGDKAQALAAEVVHHRQHPEPAPAGERVRDEVQ